MNIIRKTVLLLILANNTLTENTNNPDGVIDYVKTKEIIQDCLNEILNLLDVTESVTRNPKVRLLLLMHTNLNNLIKHKWKEHAEMKKISVAETITVPRPIYEFVEEAIAATDLANRNKSKDTINNSSEIENTAKGFFSDLLNKIYKQSISKEDSSEISLGKPKDPYIRQLDRQVYKRRMDDGMRIWQPEDPQNNTRRFSGGRPVTISQYQFIASIHVLGRFTCSGSIVSTYFVITAASCLQPGTIYNSNEGPIHVRIGSELANTRGELLPAIEVIFHPGFDPVSLANNLAMIKLNIIQNSERTAVKKIRIDSLPVGLPKDVVAKGVFILGWGDGMEMQKRKYQQLTAAFLELQTLEDCISIYSRQYVTNKNFCAGLVYRGTGTCNGDIGSPAIVLGTLVGIVSFGPPACGTVSDPTVFTRVGHYTSWINDVIDEKIPKTALSDRFWLSDQALFAQRSPILRNSHEEVLILRKLVRELDKPENMLTEVIEQDPEIEDEMKIIFQTPTTVDAAHHSLLNKSVVVIPGLHIPTVTTVPPFTTTLPSSVKDIGLPDAIPYEFVNQFIPDSDELRYIVHEVLSTNETLFKSNQNDFNTKLLLTSLETNENFEYESSDGMSIELSSERNLDEKVDIEIVPKKMNVKKWKDDDDNTQESSHRSKIGEDDIWFKVKRLKELQMKKGFTPMNKLKLKLPNNSMGKRIQSMYLTQLARKINRIRASENN